MAENDVAGQPEEGTNPLWYWVVVLIVVFMCLALAIAVIQTHAQ